LEYRHGMFEFDPPADLVPAFRQLDLPVLGVCGANIVSQGPGPAGMKNS
jgi:hypothetical protein